MQQAEQNVENLPLIIRNMRNPFETLLFSPTVMSVFQKQNDRDDFPPIAASFRFLPNAIEEPVVTEVVVKATPVKKKKPIKKEHKRATSAMTAPEQPIAKTPEPPVHTHQRAHTTDSRVEQDEPIVLNSVATNKSPAKISVANLLVKSSQERIVGQLTRSQRARLCIPNLYRPVLDSKGRIVDMVVVGSVDANLGAEDRANSAQWQELVCGREFGITLMGWSNDGSKRAPRALYATVQFGAFPHIQSKAMALSRKVSAFGNARSTESRARQRSNINELGDIHAAAPANLTEDPSWPRLLYPCSNNLPDGR